MHGVDSSTGGGKTGPVRGGGRNLDTATGVSVDVHVAVGLKGCTSLGSTAVVCASRFGVESRLVASLVVDALEDINLAAVGPVRSKGPD